MGDLVLIAAVALVTSVFWAIVFGRREAKFKDEAAALWREQEGRHQREFGTLSKRLSEDASEIHLLQNQLLKEKADCRRESARAARAEQMVRAVEAKVSEVSRDVGFLANFHGEIVKHRTGGDPSDRHFRLTANIAEEFFISPGHGERLKEVLHKWLEESVDNMVKARSPFGGGKLPDDVELIDKAESLKLMAKQAKGRLIE